MTSSSSSSFNIMDVLSEYSVKCRVPMTTMTITLPLSASIAIASSSCRRRRWQRMQRCLHRPPCNNNCKLLVFMLLLLLSFFLSMASAMIYLEEFDGALQFDAGISTTTTSITIKGKTPNHYLTRIPLPPPTYPATNAPSTMPTAPNNNNNNNSSNHIFNTANETNTNNITNANATNTPSPSLSPSSSTTIDHAADTNNSPSTTTASSAPTIPTIPLDNTTLFNTRGRRNIIIEEEQEQRNHHDDRHYYSSLETHHDVQESFQPTSSVTSFTSSLLSSLSSSSLSSTSSLFDGLYFFDDLSIINDSRNFVYYDSKQARFGVDLGPRGHAVFVNIMLPPRWYYNHYYDSDDDPSLGTQDHPPDNDEQEVGGNIIINADNETRGSDNGSSSNTSIVNNEDVWWMENEGKEKTNTITGNIFNGNITNDSNNNNNNNNNNTSILGDDASQSNASTNIEQQNDVSNIEDYFCLEDFIHWREVNQRNYSSSSPSKSSSAASSASENASTTHNVSTIALPQPNPADLINSTRPLTILVQRGRCTFESKAQMAMVINEIFSSSGRSNRIGHIIIYNNGTDDDNNTNTKEELVDMAYEREVDEDDITIGLQYIASSSGQELIHRILERQVSTFISPYLDVPMLSTKEDQNTETFDRRRRQHLRDGESNKPDWENDTIIDIFSDVEYHDKQISHGWWFPATLTRFCYSCGSELDYGLVWDDDDVRDIPSYYDGSEVMTTPQQPYGGGYPQDYFSDWFLYIRQFLIAILVLLLIGPILVMTVRWFIVGGTFRIVTDENGVRRLRVVSPNLEAFVNGTPGSVEVNGTKLDRAQVYSLPEIEYTDGVDEESSAGYIDSRTLYNNVCSDQEVPLPIQEDGACHNSTESTVASQTTPSNESPAIIGRFVSSSCCTICIDEFTLGERIRVLPRCSHVFHTDCILPWLTERQGCCPVCKVPVLPEELQRTRSPSRRLGRRVRL